MLPNIIWLDHKLVILYCGPIDNINITGWQEQITENGMWGNVTCNWHCQLQSLTISMDPHKKFLSLDKLLRSNPNIAASKFENLKNHTHIHN